MVRTEAKRHLGNYGYNPGERWCGLHQGGSNRNNEKWWDSGYVMMEKLTRFANGLDADCKRTTGKTEVPFNKLVRL